MNIFRTIKSYIRSKLSFKDSYWKVNSLFQRWIYKFRNLEIKTKNIREKSTTNLIMIKVLFIDNLWSILKTSLISIFLLLIPGWLLKVYSGNQAIIFFNKFFDPISETNISSYDGLLIAIITVIGIMLTLFLTNVAVGIESVYAELPREIRNLFIKERISNWYTNYMISIMMICLVFLGGAVINNLRFKYLIIIVIILGLYSIRAFSLLGTRSFQLLDLSSLLGILTDEFQKYAQKTTSKSKNWLEAPFQEYYRKKAKKTLLNFISLLKIIRLKSKSVDISLNDAIGETAKFLSVYQGIKTSIPTDSKWFEQKPKYESWYLSSSINVDLATNTQTDLYPQHESDSFWIENTLFEELIYTLDKKIENKDLNSGLFILQTACDICIMLSQSLDTELALNYFMKIAESIQRIEKIDIYLIEKMEEESELNQKIGYADIVGFCFIEIFLKFVEGLSSVEPFTIKQKLSKINLRDKTSLYSCDFPCFLLKHLETIQERIQYEIGIEGKIITPNWYLSMLLINEVNSQIQKLLDGFQKQLDDLIFLYEKLQSNDKYIEATTLLLRLFEFTNKYDFHLTKLRKKWDDGLNQENHKEERLYRDIWELSLQKSNSVQEILYRKYAESIPVLSKIKKREDLPDYLGRAVHVIGQRCFASIINQKYVEFDHLYKFYFIGVFSEEDYLKNILADRNSYQLFAYSIAPIIELIELSGYVYLLSALYQDTHIRETAVRIWDKFIHENEKDSLEYLSSIIRYEKSNFSLTDRSGIRSTWKLAVQKLLREIPTKESTNSPLPFLSMEVDHPSELVRAIAGDPNSLMLFYDGVDIFTVEYLYKYKNFPKFNKGSISSLQSKLIKIKKNK